MKQDCQRRKFVFCFELKILFFCEFDLWVLISKWREWTRRMMIEWMRYGRWCAWVWIANCDLFRFMTDLVEEIETIGFGKLHRWCQIFGGFETFDSKSAVLGVTNNLQITIWSCFENYSIMPSLFTDFFPIIFWTPYFLQRMCNKNENECIKLDFLAVFYT